MTKSQGHSKATASLKGQKEKQKDIAEAAPDDQRFKGNSEAAKCCKRWAMTNL
jgi:hypothetical protein